ncbi:hypothetical protein AVEN_225642-1, partial [Araneus ventricosus]
MEKKASMDTPNEEDGCRRLRP